MRVRSRRSREILCCDHRIHLYFHCSVIASMSGEEDSNEENTVTASASLSGSASGSAIISYTSGFPKKQLEYAKRARDKAGKLEVTFGGDDVLMIRQSEKIEHQHNVLSAVVNSLGFLQGQKYWFIYRLDEGRWDFDNSEEMQKAGWNGTEDAFVKMLDACGRESGFVKDSRPYDEVKLLRHFRNDLLHFESPMVKAGEEAEEYDTEEKLEAHDFPENPIEPNSTYPFKWFSYELAERSVRMSFTLWRFFARKLGKEDEFLKGISS